MTSFYDLPAGRLDDALDAAVSQAVRTPPANERLFAYPGLLEADWDWASCCHHSNILMVGTNRARPLITTRCMDPYNVVTAACVDLAQLAVDNPGDMELLHRIEQVSADLVTFTDALHKDVQTLLAGRTPTEMGLAELSSDQSERCQVIGKPRTRIAI